MNSGNGAGIFQMVISILVDHAEGPFMDKCLESVRSVFQNKHIGEQSYWMCANFEDFIATGPPKISSIALKVDYNLVMSTHNAENVQMTEGICIRAPTIRALDDQGLIGFLNSMGQTYMVE